VDRHQPLNCQHCFQWCTHRCLACSIPHGSGSLGLEMRVHICRLLWAPVGWYPCLSVTIGEDLVGLVRYNERAGTQMAQCCAWYRLWHLWCCVSVLQGVSNHRVVHIVAALASRGICRTGVDVGRSSYSISNELSSVRKIQPHLNPTSSINYSFSLLVISVSSPPRLLSGSLNATASSKPLRSA
jgi:hypothetical protein